MFNKERQESTSSCGNCENFRMSSNKCAKGYEPKFKYGAHFLCDDFKRLEHGHMTANQAIDRYFKRA